MKLDGIYNDIMDKWFGKDVIKISGKVIGNVNEKVIFVKLSYKIVFDFLFVLFEY